MLYNVVSLSRYNTIMRTFKSRDAAQRYADKLNKLGEFGTLYGVRTVAQ